MMLADPVIIERIRKLIALAEHETTNVGEARNARARAVELLDKHGIEYDSDAVGNIKLEIDRRLVDAIDDYKNAHPTERIAKEEYRRYDRDRNNQQDFDRDQRDAKRSQAESQLWGRNRRYF